MSAGELFDQLIGAGFYVAVEGELLHVGPRGQLTDEPRDSIRAARSELFLLIAGRWFRWLVSVTGREPFEVRVVPERNAAETQELYPGSMVRPLREQEPKDDRCAKAGGRYLIESTDENRPDLSIAQVSRFAEMAFLRTVRRYARACGREGSAAAHRKRVRHSGPTRLTAPHSYDIRNRCRTPRIPCGRVDCPDGR